MMWENKHNCYIHTLYSLFSTKKYCSDLHFDILNSATLSKLGLSIRCLCQGKYGMCQTSLINSQTFYLDSKYLMTGISALLKIIISDSCWKTHNLCLVSCTHLRTYSQKLDCSGLLPYIYYKLPESLWVLELNDLIWRNVPQLQPEIQNKIM